MLELSRGLPAKALAAVAELERRSVAADGGRLKLEWDVLRSRSGADVEDLLWWEGDRLVGFLGLYAFGPPTVEFVGMVDPDSRRGGIASALLDAALDLSRDRAYSEALLVTPRTSHAGKAFAITRRARFDHAEHAMTLTQEVADGINDPLTTVRRAAAEDVAAVSGLLAAAFGSEPTNVADRIATQTECTLVVERDGAAIGTLRRTLNESVGGIYGFAIEPAWQGRGIGGDVLRRVCRRLRADGAQQIGLEVAVDNDRALGLYTRVGFTKLTTEDYYALPVS